MEHINGELSINCLLDEYNDNIPGVGLLAIKDNKILYEKCCGLSNMEYNLPITPDTVFNLASLSKQFTAMAVMLLHREGRIDYDERIIKFLPELSHFCPGVTIRHLLNNSSGIENYYRILENLGKSEAGFTNNDFYETIKEQHSLLFNPGEKFDYSNSNYVLLALIIEAISKMSYGEFLKVNIFDPLGMKNSLVYDESKPIVLNKACGYSPSDDGYFCDDIAVFTTGDGCVFSTMHDLYLWNRALESNILISRDLLESAFISGKSNDGADLGYGFGWEIKSDDGLRRIYHTGLDGGFRNIITKFPDEGLTIILLSNNGGFSYQKRLNITNILYEKFCK